MTPERKQALAIARQILVSDSIVVGRWQEADLVAQSLIASESEHADKDAQIAGMQEALAKIAEIIPPLHQIRLPMTRQIYDVISTLPDATSRGRELLDLVEACWQFKMSTAGAEQLGGTLAEQFTGALTFHNEWHDRELLEKERELAELKGRV